MKRSQSDFALSKSSENNNNLMADVNIDFDPSQTVVDSSTNNNSSTPNHNTPTTTIENNKNKTTVAATTTTINNLTTKNTPPPSPTLFKEKQDFNFNAPLPKNKGEKAESGKKKPNTIKSHSNSDLLEKKKYATLNSSSDLSPKKSTGGKLKSWIKKSTSHNNLLDVDAVTAIEGGLINSSSSLNNSNNPSGNSSGCSSLNSSSGMKKKEESFKSKIDNFFSIKGNRASLKFDSLTATGAGSDPNMPPTSLLSPDITRILGIESDVDTDDYTDESDFESDPIKSNLAFDSASSNSSGGSGNTNTTTSTTTATTNQDNTSNNVNLNSVGSTHTLTKEEEEEAEQDLKKALERRLMRRPTVAELKLDNILFQNDFEDAAKEQKKVEIKNKKLFVGTRPSKKQLFYSPSKNNNGADINNNEGDDEEESARKQRKLITKMQKLETNDDEGEICKILVGSCQGWKREVELDLDQSNTTTTTCCTIDEIENEIPHYLESFCKDKHKNYIAYNPDNDKLGPVVISIKREAERTPSYRKLKKKKKETLENNSNTSNNNNTSTGNLNNNNNNTSNGSLNNLTNSPTMNNNSIVSKTYIESTERKFKTIIRTKEGEDRFYLSSGKSSPHELINTIKSFYLSEYSDLTFKKVPNRSESRKLLLHWESSQMTKDYKVGLLYRKNGQVNENDFFSNIDESKDLREFLDFIGTKVKLKGWEGYKGGLDVKNDTTGLHSIFNTREFSINETKKFKVQIMFHVSTFLPYYPNDLQQLERKRHIGNDIVVIIFQDSNCSPPFRPSMIKSEFNHVFIVIEPVEKQKEDETTRYSVSVTFKEGVSTCQPTFSSSKVWKKDSVFLEHLIVKLINSEKASYYSSSFSEKMKRTRLSLLKNIVKNLQN
ncbi:hypothetical protein CYY_005555 [Polysphondylium violaceum]|uniref:Rap-GAP domain-containing protein n=1 Tax=Polysphondylium violaceum TaxID=133409 RepID=A0A8J4V6R6_9MYCE|nr:hypothetical protein CYY_005555 [Polysphondylium violaceum]